MIYTNLYSQRNRPSEETDPIFSYTLSEGVRIGIFNQIKNANRSGYVGRPRTKMRYLYNYLKDFCENHLFGYISDRSEDAFKAGYSYSDTELLTDLYNWFGRAQEEEIFDFIEVTLENMKRYFKDPKPVVASINKIFERERIGYEIINNQVIRKTDEVLHQEIVKPAVLFLQKSGFDTAEEEFLAALRDLSDGDYKDAITKANASFESTMKKLLGVSGGNASDLLKKMEEGGFIEGYMKSKMQLLPVIRNEVSSAHGKKEKVKVPKELAELSIHLAGSFIKYFMSKVNQD